MTVRTTASLSLVGLIVITACGGVAGSAVGSGPPTVPPPGSITDTSSMALLRRCRRRGSTRWSPTRAGAAFADITVAILRTEAARDPHNRELHDLIGELSTRSDEFRRRWGAHDVRHHRTGFKSFNHPIVGELTLAYRGMELEVEPGLTLTVYAAEPDSPSEDAIRLQRPGLPASTTRPCPPRQTPSTPNGGPSSDLPVPRAITLRWSASARRQSQTAG